MECEMQTCDSYAESTVSSFINNLCLHNLEELLANIQIEEKSLNHFALIIKIGRLNSSFNRNQEYTLRLFQF